MTQSELAEMSVVTRNMIARMENGYNIGIHYICKILAALNKKIHILEDNLVEGNFDEFYEKEFGESLRSNIGVDAEGNQIGGLFKKSDISKPVVKDWKKSNTFLVFEYSHTN